MLSLQEKNGAVVLLQFLLEEDVISLAQTITKGQIETPSSKVAIEAAVIYSENPLELLRRKKIKRDHLFQYLTSQQVVISPKADKHDLIQKVLEFWGSNSVPPALLERVRQEDHKDVNIGVQTEQAAYNTQQCVPATSETQKYHQPKNTNLDQELAEKFTQWFYQMLNSYHPFSQQAPVEQFGAQHFFSDCKLKLVCAVPDIRKEEHTGAQSVCSRLLALVKEEQLKFNPNLDPGGVKGMANPHGLKAVSICGTVHLQGQCVGIFEQQFGLVRDPDSQNNLKIKFTNLKLKREDTIGMPTLQDTGRLLSIDS